MFPFAPPTRIRFFDAAGMFHLRPFVHGWRPRPATGGTYQYEEDRSVVYPIRFLVRGSPHSIAGMAVSRWRLFGVDEPGRIFLMGSDDLGRDQFSRLLHGGQISLLSGLLATALALFLALLLGGTAGFYGGWFDEMVMRTAELFQALPWLYLLLAVRAALPLDVEPRQAFLLVIGVVGVVGWARPARLIRGVVLTARTRDYVLAARGFGASDGYLLVRHVLPDTASVLVTQAALLAPQYVLAEVTLSFFGLGIDEPVASWGNMLGLLQQYHVIASYWWVFLPAAALVPIFLGFYAAAALLGSKYNT